MRSASNENVTEGLDVAQNEVTERVSISGQSSDVTERGWATYYYGKRALTAKEMFAEAHTR